LEFGPTVWAKLRCVLAVLELSFLFASAFKGCGYLPVDACLGDYGHKSGTAAVLVLVYSFGQIVGRADVVVGVSIGSVETN